MKPLDGTFAANAETHGVAGLWIEGGRVGTEPRTYKGMSQASKGKGVFRDDNWDAKDITVSASGRWPANLILDGEAGLLLDQQSGELHTHPGKYKADSVGGQIQIAPKRKAGTVVSSGDTGGASRFFYCPKASRSERTAGGKVVNKHPTVKPVALMQYLARLTRTPTGGTVLDPFMGSGSTAIACIREGRPFIGIEKDRESFDTAVARIEEEMNTLF